MAGFLMALFALPGVVVHELAHRWFCWLFGVRVVKACYFRFGSPPGYVVYERPDNLLHHMWICTGPFLVNTLAGLAVGFRSSAKITESGALTAVDYLTLWMAVSIAMHAFPSTGDAKSVWTGLWSGRASVFARIAGVPVVGLMYLGALGAMLRLDIVYGLAIVVIGPRLLMGLLS